MNALIRVPYATAPSTDVLTSSHSSKSSRTGTDYAFTEGWEITEENRDNPHLYMGRRIYVGNLGSKCFIPQLQQVSEHIYRSQPTKFIFFNQYTEELKMPDIVHYFEEFGQLEDASTRARVRH